MLLDFFYGDHQLTVDIPKSSIKGILEQKPLPVPESEDKIVKEALAYPIDSAPLSELVSKGETVCIIVGDITRLWVRHHIIILPLLEELRRGGISDDDIFIISATGDHRAQTPEEHSLIVGKEAYNRVKIFDHSAHEDDLVSLGTTTWGTPVQINRRVVDANRVIITGGIVYHFLAGWGGGKKAVMPGVAGYETIMKNHSLAFLPEGQGLNTNVCGGLLEGNPCSDDMVQGASLVSPDFLVNTIINEDMNLISRVVAGNYLTAFQKGCSIVEDYCAVEIEDKADVVIASCGGYPKDINFYQSYKTIYNAQFALAKGGTLILVSESREKIGSDDFINIFMNYPDNKARERFLRKSYTIGGHMGYHAAVIAEENDVLVHSNLNDQLVQAMGMIPIRSLDEALTFVRKKHGGIPPSYIIPHGGTTFPKLK